MTANRPQKEGWRAQWYDVIFESNTKSGKLFDVVLLLFIIGSLLAIMLESVPSLLTKHHLFFCYAEWTFTFVFSIEYLVRLIVVEKKRKYVLSFYGLVDLLSILPTYLALVLVGAQYFMVLRAFRLIRVFRVLKMVRFLGEAQILSSALRASRVKITVFLVAVMCVVFVMGTVMYVVEGPENGFTSIPVSIYWCIVTLTTVGYGDIAPNTLAGQVIASVIMILGYGIIAVPTGIVTNEMTKANERSKMGKPFTCNNCGESSHAIDAKFCKTCGNSFE